MANNHEQFIAFDKEITATETRLETLRNNRDALRSKIRKYFNDNWGFTTEKKLKIFIILLMKNIDIML